MEYQRSRKVKSSNRGGYRSSESRFDQSGTIRHDERLCAERDAFLAEITDAVQQNRAFGSLVEEDKLGEIPEAFLHWFQNDSNLGVWWLSSETDLATRTERSGKVTYLVPALKGVRDKNGDIQILRGLIPVGEVQVKSYVPTSRHTYVRMQKASEFRKSADPKSWWGPKFDNNGNVINGVISDFDDGIAREIDQWDED